MSPSPTDIRHYAQGLVESYGPHSLRYADEMIQAYLANGDSGALSVWREVRHQLLALYDATGVRKGDALPAVALAE
jgi:hypothetical protein